MRFDLRAEVCDAVRAEVLAAVRTERSVGPRQRLEGIQAQYDEQVQLLLAIEAIHDRLGALSEADRQAAADLATARREGSPSPAGFQPSAGARLGRSPGGAAEGLAHRTPELRPRDAARGARDNGAEGRRPPWPAADSVVGTGVNEAATVRDLAARLSARDARPD